MGFSSITSLFASASDQVTTSADEDRYEAAIRCWSGNVEKRTKYVVSPKDTQEVSRVVRNN
jgi:hypothetical protein